MSMWVCGLFKKAVNCVKQYPQIMALMDGADHIDVKVVEGNVSMRQFIAGMLSFYPWWIIFLYGIRAVFVRLLGMRQPARPDELPKLLPEDIPMIPGEKATFFILRSAKDEEYWIAETPEDKHLRAYFGVVVEPIADSRKRFHVVTIIHYKHWTGPVYFNAIRPFHHLVVRRMARAGVNQLSRLG